MVEVDGRMEEVHKMKKEIMTANYIKPTPTKSTKAVVNDNKYAFDYQCTPMKKQMITPL